MKLILDAKNRQVIKGQVKADVNIIRSISGLALKINCYVIDGTNYGSCVFPDLCDYIKKFFKLDENNCPENLIDNDIKCTCPFDLPIRDVNINQTIDVPDFANTIFSFLSTGEFEVTIKGTIGTTSILCVNMKFSIRKSFNG